MKKMMKLLLTAAVCAVGVSELTYKTKAENGLVRILFTHDLRDHAEPFRSLGEENAVISFGGYAYLASAINEYKTSNTIVLDAGNFSTGTMYGSLNTSSAPDLAMMYNMGYDAVTPGIKDFAYGTDRFAQMLTVEGFFPAITAANLEFASGSAGSTLKDAWQAAGAESCTVIQTEEYKIGVFGLLGMDDAYGEESALIITDPAEAAANAVSTLKREGADLIVCLYSTDEEITEEFTAESGIDVIIAGGSHKPEENYTVSADTVIVSSEALGKTLGVLEYDPFGKKVVSYENVTVSDSGFPADEAISGMINSYKNSVQNNVMARYGLDVSRPAFRTTYSLTTTDRLATDRKFAESADLVTDAMTEAYRPAETDEAKPVAIIRENMVTGTLFEGTVSANDIFSLASDGIGSDGVPGYNLVHVYMQGSDLIALCEMDLMLNIDNTDEQFHFGRMYYEYSMNRPETNRIVDVYTEEADGYYIAVTADRYYPVVTTAEILQAIPEMIAKTGGELKCNIYDESGAPVTDFEIMTMRTGDGVPVKTWSAMASYMEHFDRGSDGIDLLPNTYKKARKQRAKTSSLNVIKLFKHASRATLEYWLKLIVIPVAVLIGLNILVWLLNFKKRK